MEDLANYLDQVESVNMNRLRRKTRIDLIMHSNQFKSRKITIEKFKKQIAMFENLKIKYIEDEDKLHKLFDMDFINSHGENIPIDLVMKRR